MKDIDELIKSGALVKGTDPSLVVHKLPLGIPALDELLGGGLPMGRCVEAYGPESTGKTLLAQYATAAVQKSQYPLALYMDMERSFDQTWWSQSGVDTDKLLVSAPATAEQAIDIIRTVMSGSNDLGIVVLDSIAAMTPMPEMDPEKSSENKTMGLQARAVTLMYRQIVPLLDNRIIFLALNQMRDNIGGFDELQALPGGKAQRHYSHVILRTRRESWINEKKDSKNHIGFYMEITSRKNKVANTPDGTNITLPFLFSGQFDLLVATIEEAIDKNLITRKGPYYKWNETSHLGMQNLRQYFTDNPTEVALLESMLKTI